LARLEERRLRSMSEEERFREEVTKQEQRYREEVS
jgi:hypothetical protein